MDVVRTNIDQIGGTIDIKSVAGEVVPSPSRSR
jgi:chemotaxis protein histidine kinase CheA